MSHRSRKRNREKKRELKEAPSRPKGKFAIIGRRRFALAAVAGMLTMILIAVLGGRQPPRITVVNRTGEPLNDLKIDFPGGSVGKESVPDGDKASLLLRPAPENFKRPGSGPITLTCKVGNDLPSRFFSRVHGQDYGAHDIITVARQPDGAVVVTASEPGGGGMSFRDLLRRVGIGR
jgi:hypothetical protein